MAVFDGGATATTATTNTTDTSANSSIRVASSVALVESPHDVLLAEEAADALAADQLSRAEQTVCKSAASFELSADFPVTTGDYPYPQTLHVGANQPTTQLGTPGGAPEVRDRAICDEEITYLGYFSSDEMDMLRFLQEKTANLRQHLDKVVRAAEVHYRRDYLWHKLMQRPSTPNGSDHAQQMGKSLTASSSSSSADLQMPLTVEELVQLLQIVEAIDLASLDPNLSTFATMHVNWYLKLLKAFNELRQSGGAGQTQRHRIYTVKASKILLLYIDPKCTSAFILLSINNERGSVELSMLLKDKQACSRPADEQQPAGAAMELEPECQQLISDFINFCATFMWSNLLA